MSRSTLLRSSLLASVLFLFPASFAAADDTVKDTAASEVSIQPDGGNFITTTTNRRFETDLFAAALDATKKEPGMSGSGEVFYQLLLIEQITVNKEGPDIDTEPVSNKVKVTAYSLSKSGGKGATRFTLEADGDDVKVDGPYLTVTRLGCCALGNTYAVFSLETGAYLFNATGEGESGQWATIGQKGGWATERLVSFHAMPTMADDVVLKGAPNAAAVINYASTTAAIQHILVTVPKAMIDNNDPLENWLPKLDLISKDQPKGTDSVFFQTTDAPDKAYDGVIVRLTLDPKTVIRIPIKGDHLDIAHAKLPNGFALKEAPVQ